MQTLSPRADRLRRRRQQNKVKPTYLFLPPYRYRERALPPYSGKGLTCIWSYFCLATAESSMAMDHRDVPHEQLGIDSAALALAHREYHLDQSIAK